MKYIYTFLFIFSVTFSFAQDVTWENLSDTVVMDKLGSDIEYHSLLTNNSLEVVGFRWRATLNAPSNWDAYMCEELVCWPSVSVKSWNDFDLDPGAEYNIYSHIEIDTDTGSGSLTVCVFQRLDSAGTETCFEYVAMSDTTPDTTASIYDIVQQRGMLRQNAPNPYKDNTVIGYEIFSDNGLIRVHDLTGKMIREVTLTSREGFVTFGSDLGAGVYFYTLWDNGEMVDTKRMQVIE